MTKANQRLLKEILAQIDTCKANLASASAMGIPAAKTDLKEAKSRLRWFKGMGDS